MAPTAGRRQRGSARTPAPVAAVAAAAALPTPAEGDGLPLPLCIPVEIIASPDAFELVRASDLLAHASSLEVHELAAEAALLRRLLYKAANQHRSGAHFHAARRVRSFARLRSLAGPLYALACAQQQHPM